MAVLDLSVPVYGHQKLKGVQYSNNPKYGLKSLIQFEHCPNGNSHSDITRYLMNPLEPTEHQGQVYEEMGTELLPGTSSRWTNCFTKNEDAYNQIKDIELPCKNQEIGTRRRERYYCDICSIKVLITSFTNYNETDHDNSIYCKGSTIHDKQLSFVPRKNVYL
jgi:hypothetical protein